MADNFILKVEVVPGATITDAIADAKEIAQQLGLACVQFESQGITVNVAPWADVNAMVRQFHEACTTGDDWIMSVRAYR